jgi:Uri superfamily endonuclease
MPIFKALMTRSAGTYILILKVAVPIKIRVGKLGVQRFSAGRYAYVGSAFGPGGLQARLKHHRRVARSPRWHIDYLRRAAKLSQIWYSDHPRKLEHEWAAQIQQNRHIRVPVPGFGSSDCRCASHLFRFQLSHGLTDICDDILAGLKPAGSIKPWLESEIGNLKLAI